MPIYKIVFSNDAIHTLGIKDESPDFIYRIDAMSADVAVGLAELEFKQKHPQKLHNHYRPHVVANDIETAQRVQHFQATAPLNPDQ